MKRPEWNDGTETVREYIDRLELYTDFLEKNEEEIIEQKFISILDYRTGEVKIRTYTNTVEDVEDLFSDELHGDTYHMCTDSLNLDIKV